MRGANHLGDKVRGTAERNVSEGEHRADPSPTLPLFLAYPGAPCPTTTSAERKPLPHPVDTVLSDTVISKSPEATEALAARLARELRPGDVVALIGPLGSGKTAFTRGLVAALPAGEMGEKYGKIVVNSPTYAIMNHYRTAPPVYHFDFYRLTGLDDLESTGYWDVVGEGRGIVVIEWADRVEGAIDDTAWLVELGIRGETRRSIRISRQGAE